MMKDFDTYENALKGAMYYHQLQAGFLHVAGPDRLDFLQRQTTNDLRQLRSDRSISTVLTSPTARILDVFRVIDEGDSFGVVTLPGRFTETTKFLRGRIFFTDKVTLDDKSAEVAQILLFGPHKDSVLDKLGLKPLAPDNSGQCKIANQSVTIIADKILGDIGYRFLVPISSLDVLIGVLEECRAISIDAETFELLRVESGQPGPVSELVETYTPLEVGLQELISDSKGCYTGQEIIARQIAYDKVTKKLVGIKLNDVVKVGSEIRVEDKVAGTLTSVTNSPHFGNIGLGIIRRQYNESGAEVLIVDTNGEIISGEVVKLPFR